jgi:hypothetical protein
MAKGLDDPEHIKLAARLPSPMLIMTHTITGW